MFSSSNTAYYKMPHLSFKTMESRRVVTGHREFAWRTSRKTTLIIRHS